MLLALFCIVKLTFAPQILNEPASMYGIAVAHSAFNVLCTAMLLPAGGWLEKLAIRLVPDKGGTEKTVKLDERLLATPSLALERSRAVAAEMAQCAVRSLEGALDSLTNYSARRMGMEESEEATALLKAIGDFERISDHAVNVLESAEELRGKQLAFSRSAQAEFDTLSGALREILELTLEAFEKHDAAAAAHVEPLEEVIDALKEQMRTRHILRMQQGNCSIEAGFVWSDLLTNLERTSDHCSNIAGCIIDTAQHNLNLHESLGLAKRESESFRSMFRGYAKKYALPEMAKA